MSKCAACGTPGTTQAHVKDKSECLKEGIADHKFLNIVELCYNCHYLLFDERKMGIKKIGEKYFFIFIDENEQVIAKESFATLNVRDEYITWKNVRCYSRLWSHLFG